jgi:hypothetical protein
MDPLETGRLYKAQPGNHTMRYKVTNESWIMYTNGNIKVYASHIEKRMC